jgi:L-amino acid N-acyltransferase YncA
MNLEFAVEAWGKASPDMEILFPLHWQEIALNKDEIKLDIDFERYAEAEANGHLHVVTARDDGILVGYHVWFVGMHMHYKSSRTAVSDVVYLLPMYRKGLAGYRFLKYSLDSLAALSVQRMVMNVKLHHDFGPVLKRLGMGKIEELWSKVI